MDNAGYVIAGYALTAAALGAYVAGLFRRARRARSRVAAIASRRTR